LAVEVFLFQGGSLVAQVTGQCTGDFVTVGPIPAGIYDLAAVGWWQQFPIGAHMVAGKSLLGEFYPNAECTDPDHPVPCDPLRIDVSGESVTAVPLTLYCDVAMSGGAFDVCGGS
jgi:hypothetical protein